VIVRHEHREEVGFQSLSATTGPTHAKEIRLPLQVHQPVGRLAVVGGEHLKEVIANRLVYAFSFGEAASAVLDSHAVAFRFDSQ
jgi:hypothetical protein